MYEYNDEGKRKIESGEKDHKGVILGPCDGNRTSKIFFLSDTEDIEETREHGLKGPFLYSNP